MLMAEGTNIGKAYLQVVPVAQGFQSSLSKAINSEAGGAGESVGNTLVSKIKGIIATAGIGVMIGNVIKQGLAEGGKLEQSMGGITAILGEEAFAKVNEYAQNAAKNLQISANEYMEQVTSFSARLMQGLGGDTEATVEYANMAIQDMSDNANKMGTSIESIQNAYQGFAKNNFTMLDNLKLGYGGTQSEMIRLINDSGVLGKTITSLDGITLDQMIAAIHQVQENMGIAGTSAQEAQTTISGSMNALKAAWTNFVANMTLGEDIQPSLDVLSDTLQAMLDNVIPAVMNVLETLFPAVLQMVINNLPYIIQSVTRIITQLLTTFTQNLPQLLKMGLQLIQELAKGLLNALPQVSSAVGQVIKSAISYLAGTVAQWISMGSQLLQGLAQGIGNAVGSVITKVKGYVNNIISSVKKFFGIHSPSRIFAEIGEMNMLGLAQGIEENLKPVTDAMDEASRIATADFQNQISLSSLGTVGEFGNGSTTNYGGVAINVYASDGQSARSIAEEVMNIMQNEVTAQRLVFR